MRTLKSLMCFVAFWALAGSMSAEDVKEPIVNSTAHLDSNRQDFVDSPAEQ
jgi:hypothetical protein